MSRSFRKAIYKDKGHRKGDYWKTHRRVNNSILKHYIEGARYMSMHSMLYNEYEEFLKWKNIFKKEHGLDEEEAGKWALNLTDGDLCFSRLAGNCFQEWWDEPTLKSPRQLINDWDYSDYKIDNEYKWRKSHMCFYNCNSNRLESGMNEHENRVRKLRRK